MTQRRRRRAGLRPKARVRRLTSGKRVSLRPALGSLLCPDSSLVDRPREMFFRAPRRSSCSDACGHCRSTQAFTVRPSTHFLSEQPCCGPAHGAGDALSAARPPPAPGSDAAGRGGASPAQRGRRFFTGKAGREAPTRPPRGPPARSRRGGGSLPPCPLQGSPRVLLPHAVGSVAAPWALQTLPLTRSLAFAFAGLQNTTARPLCHETPSVKGMAIF